MSEAYDRNKLVELFGGDPATLAEVEREFFDTARDAALEIAATGDLAIIARAAHRLKGASGMIGAAPLREIAEAVERAAKAHDLDTVRGLETRFHHEILRVADQAGLPAEIVVTPNAASKAEACADDRSVQDLVDADGVDARA